MAEDTPTVFGEKATEQIAKTVREDMRRMMNVRGNRGRWQFHGGGSLQTAWATITESGQDAEFQTLTLYRTAKPTTFPSTTCGDEPFIDFAYTLCDPIAGTSKVLVPAGYKAGTACLLKMQDCDPGTGTSGGADQAWDGWVVVAANLMRCAMLVPRKVVCCPLTNEIKITEFDGYWFVGGGTSEVLDPC